MIEEDPQYSLEPLPSDNPRISNVKISLNRSIDRILSSWSHDFFLECFPGLSAKNDFLLNSVRLQVLQAVDKNLHRALSEYVAVRLKEPMEKLSALVTESQQTRSEKAWRPTGKPLEDLAAHDAKVMLHEIDKLKKTVESEKEKTTILKEQVQDLRHRALDNEREILKRLQKIKDARDLSLNVPERKV